MELTFENCGTNTYLVYEMKETDAVDSMSLGMLTNNHIAGFAPVSFTQMDTTKYIKYNVSAKVSVKQFFSGPVNKKRLLGVFSGVVDAMLSAEDYMLDPNTILLDLDYIFADVSTCETELVCLPIMNQQHENQNLAMFFKNILFTTQFDQTENCDHVAQLINYLNINSTLVLADFKTLLNSLSGVSAPQPQVVAKPVQQPVPQPVQQPVPQPVQQPAPQPAPRPVQQPVPQPAPVPNVPQPQKPTPQKVAPAVPNVPPVKPVQPAPAGAAQTEKPMSWFYLMQHYNKENAAIYKAQQEQAKAQKGASAPVAAAPKTPNAKAPMPAGFAVPGQSSAGFAVPGQPAQKPVAAPQPVKPQPIPQPAVPQKPVVQQPVPQPVSKPAPQPIPQPAYPAQNATPLNFGETTVLGGPIGETTVLGAAAAPNRREPHLIRTKNNEKIPLNKPVFRIGKERSYVDYFIGDNTAISRSHANVVDHNGEFFVVDTNSTNHTYVNGAMIQSGVETKLAHGDKVRLANEDFEFKMY